MSHHHHEHHHAHDHEQEMPVREKMKKLMEHWIKHNIDHAETYRNWKEKAEAEGLAAVAALLEDAAVTTMALNATFEKALRELS